MGDTRRGTMVISVDLELAWGRFDTMPVEVLEKESATERTHIRRLLTLLDEYEIPATWAMVGHLMLHGCARNPDGVVHADVTPHAAYSWFPEDWYRYDPCTTASAAPGWYAPDILEWIRAARVKHEIGSHSFAHIVYGDPECAAAMAQADLRAAVEVASKEGLTLDSFVFPRNKIGHLDLLKAVGILAYRGDDPPHRTPHAPKVVRKLITVLDQVLGLSPRAVHAEEVLTGLWNIPGNHFYLPREGPFKMLPIMSRVLKAKRGMRQAIRDGTLYHLWFHPFDLSADPDAIFWGLERIFAYAKRQREAGNLDILTMREYALRLQRSKAWLN